MRIVDVHTFPDQSEIRNQLVAAWEALDGDRGERSDPVDPAAPLGLGFPAELSDDEVRERADAIRDRLDAALGDAGTVRLQLADGQSDEAGGSPDHTE